MKIRFNVKRKSIIPIVMLVLVSVIIYIWTCSTFINEMNYRKRAYAIENYSKNIPDWKTGKVTLVKLEKEPCYTPQILSSKINRYLLFLNGGYAVRVEMNTDLDGLLGPSILYFNPFTKQCIGGAIRE